MRRAQSWKAFSHRGLYLCTPRIKTLKYQNVVWGISQYGIIPPPPHFRHYHNHYRWTLVVFPYIFHVGKVKTKISGTFHSSKKINRRHRGGRGNFVIFQNLPLCRLSIRICRQIQRTLDQQKEPGAEPWSYIMGPLSLVVSPGPLSPQGDHPRTLQTNTCHT